MQSVSAGTLTSSHTKCDGYNSIVTASLVDCSILQWWLHSLSAKYLINHYKGFYDYFVITCLPVEAISYDMVQGRRKHCGKKALAPYLLVTHKQQPRTSLSFIKSGREITKRSQKSVKDVAAKVKRASTPVTSNSEVDPECIYFQ